MQRSAQRSRCTAPSRAAGSGLTALWAWSGSTVTPLQRRPSFLRIWPIRAKWSSAPSKIGTSTPSYPVRLSEAKSGKCSSVTCVVHSSRLKPSSIVPPPSGRSRRRLHQSARRETPSGSALPSRPDRRHLAVDLGEHLLGLAKGGVGRRHAAVDRGLQQHLADLLER